MNYPRKSLGKAEKLVSDINERGDPTCGVFMVDIDQPWRLYTDASKYGIGACLYIGEAYAEDISWLRKVGDVRPIDTVELEAIIRGMNSLLIGWIRALNIKKTDKLSVEIYCDNKPVLGQLARKNTDHWQSAKGYCQAATEARLQMIEEVICLYNLNVSFQYVETSKNPADALTRFPSYLMWNKLLANEKTKVEPSTLCSNTSSTRIEPAIATFLA